MHKDAHNWFTILINILRDILPQVGNYGAVVDENTEFEKLYITKSATFSMLASKRIIAQQSLSYCKEDFPLHRVDRIFLQKLSK